MKYLLTIIYLLFVPVFCANKIRLEEVSVLTLYKGKMTNGRRASPIQQLECVGGSAGCGSATPDVVQCYNRGSDGYDIQWECKADLDNDYRFGKVEVQCEGYDYPEDKYILKGSCGLKYELELTEAGRERRRYSNRDSYQQKENSHNYRSYSSNKKASWFQFSNLMGLIPIIGMIGIIYYFCLAPSNSGRDNSQPSAPPAPPAPGFIHDEPPPDYNSATGGAYYRGQSSSCGGNIYPDISGYSANPRQQQSGGLFSGFWGGATLGGLTGYLFGSSNRPRSHYGSDYYSAPRSSWFGGGGHSDTYTSGFSGFSRPTQSERSPPRSSGSRMTSGFGGTTRR